jgi:hypothetical protein
VPVKTEPFDIGDDVDVTLTFTDAAGLPADPSACTVEVQSPADHISGAITRTLALNQLTKLSTGVYLFVQRVTMGGLWYVKSTVTLAAGTQQVQQRTIQVSPRTIP